jgi:hypothetical protein
MTIKNTITTYLYSISQLNGTSSTPSINPSIPPADGTVSGQLGYDYLGNVLYYNDDGVWTAINSTGSTGATGPTGPVGPTGGCLVESYGLIAESDIPIPSGGGWYTITGFTGSPSPYSTISGWDLGTGIYTNLSSSFQNLTFNVDISWKAGISNIGRRFMQLVYNPSGGGGPVVIKQSNTIPDSYKGIETTQEMSMHVVASPGDQVWIQVSHDASQTLYIGGGIGTSVCGLRIQ